MYFYAIFSLTFQALTTRLLEKAIAQLRDLFAGVDCHWSLTALLQSAKSFILPSLSLVYLKIVEHLQLRKNITIFIHLHSSWVAFALSTAVEFSAFTGLQALKQQDESFVSIWALRHFQWIEEYRRHTEWEWEFSIAHWVHSFCEHAVHPIAWSSWYLSHSHGLQIFESTFLPCMDFRWVLPLGTCFGP